MRQLLGKGRKDKSGDFTSGANLSSKNIDLIEKELKNRTPETEDLKEIFKWHYLQEQLTIRLKVIQYLYSDRPETSKRQS